MAVELVGVLGQGVEEVHLGGDVQQGVATGLDQGSDELQVDAGGLDGLLEVGLSQGVEVLSGELTQVLGVEVTQLLNVEDGGGLGDAADVEHTEELLLAVLAPGGTSPAG